MPSPEEGAAEQFTRTFKEQIFPSLVNGISDDFFQIGREEALSERIGEIVDAHIISDELPVGQKLRIHLIDSIMADIARSK